MLKHKNIINACLANKGRYVPKWDNYSHKDIVRIEFYFHSDNFWVAQYFDADNNTVFDEAYKDQEEFAKMNDCFSADIIELVVN
jgi:hypothetical protein